MIDCSPKQNKHGSEVSLLGERRIGIPRSDAERVAQHYGITIEEACEWLRIHTAEELLPERGTGLQRPSVVYQGEPQGQFVYPYIEVLGHPNNKIPVGEEIKLRANYKVSCPGQPWWSPAWTMAVKAKGNGIASKFDWTYYTGAEVIDRGYLSYPSYPIMPDRPITLEVTLWGNPAAFQDLPLEDP